jgi:hypothetical protein
MDAEFTFYDYIDADASGGNVIKNWLDGEGKPAKAHFTMIIGYLRASPPANWPSQYSKRMKGGWKGFKEFRKTGSVQYRLIGKVVGRKVFLIAWGIHKDQHFTTSVTPQTALSRVAQMMDDARYRREHEYD